jgi:hypothetical protein
VMKKKKKKKKKKTTCGLRDIYTVQCQQSLSCM